MIDIPYNYPGSLSYSLNSLSLQISPGILLLAVIDRHPQLHNILTLAPTHQHSLQTHAPFSCSHTLYLFALSSAYFHSLRLCISSKYRTWCKARPKFLLVTLSLDLQSLHNIYGNIHGTDL